MNAEPNDSRILVERAQRDDRAALESLLIRHLPRLEGYLRLRMGPAMRAKESSADLMQSVAREVLEDLSGFEFRSEPAFRHWLFTRAQNKLLERHRWLTAKKRDMGREEPVLDSAVRTHGLADCYGTLCTPSRELAAEESVRRIEAAIDDLPEDHREAILLHRIVGLSHAEIAAHLGRSEGAVRNLVYRGLSRLALRLEAQGDTPHDA